MRFLLRCGMALPCSLWLSSCLRLRRRVPRSRRLRRNRLPPPQQSQTQQPNYTIAVTVPVVNVDAVVTDNDGNYVNGLKKENFRILEDGAPQEITNFSTGDAPITIVMLVEFNMRGFGYYNYTGITLGRSVPAADEAQRLGRAGELFHSAERRSGFHA